MHHSDPTVDGKVRISNPLPPFLILMCMCETFQKIRTPKSCRRRSKNPIYNPKLEGGEKRGGIEGVVGQRFKENHP
jgi:hypothetical protein